MPRPGRGVAQPGSASHWGCGGRWFESSRPDHSINGKFSTRKMSNTAYSMSMVQAAPAGEPSGIMVFLIQSFPFLAIFVIFYLLWIRPQAQRAKEHRATIAAVTKGDDVITAGGIRGRVTKVSEDEAEVEIAQGVRVKVIKSTLTQVLRANAKPAND